MGVLKVKLLDGTWVPVTGPGIGPPGPPGPPGGGTGSTTITVSDTEPTTPAVDDVWIDTSE